MTDQPVAPVTAQGGGGSRPPRKPLSRRGRFFRGLTIALLVTALLVVAGAVWVYWEAVRTFEVRRVSLPTRIYADKFILSQGTLISAENLNDRLARLGYRSVEEPDVPLQIGEYRRDESGYQIHLRGFRHPAGDLEPQMVSFQIEAGAITDTSAPAGEQTAALEPELLTSILSETLENRRPVTLDQVPRHVIDAILVTEDVRFFQHPGVDPVGLFRALFRNIRAGGVAEGGSTLTQQLVKNYYLTGERSFRRKAVEAVMSVILDARYSKEEILEAYVNDIYLGRNRSISILGVGEAARYFFGKPIAEVTKAEAALLAGMIRSPNNYNPFEEPEVARKRRATVARALLNNERITQEEYAEILEAPLPDKPSNARPGLQSIPYYVDAVIDELRRDYGIEDVRGRGLSVYTAINLEWQDEAGQQLQSGIARLEKVSSRLRNAEQAVQGALIAVDVETGEIRALVGGRDYTESQFNRATRALRQVGSLFKPFVLLAAFQPSLSRQTITPATQVNDARFVVKRRFSRDWSPRNYDGRYYGVVTVRQALEKSMNAAFVRLGLSVGLDAIARTARVLGIEQELETVPSMVLGPAAIPPIEMAEAYTTMARMGSRVPLHAIRYVASDGGENVAGAGEIQPVQVFPARDVFLAVNIMEGVVDQGTAAGARSVGFRRTAAGKTGTTNDKRDAWFIGFTPQTLSLVWVGFDNNTPIGVSGSEAAVPIWGRFMRAITDDERDRDFPVPSGIQFAEIDVETGELSTPYCPAASLRNEAFKTGTAPARPCQKHQPQPTFTPYDPYLSTDPLAPLDTSLPDRDGPVLDGGIDTFRDPVPEPAPPVVVPPRTDTAPRPPALSPREPLPDPDTSQPRERPPVVEPVPRTRPEEPEPPEPRDPPGGESPEGSRAGTNPGTAT